MTMTPITSTISVTNMFQLLTVNIMLVSLSLMFSMFSYDCLVWAVDMYGAEL